MGEELDLTGLSVEAKYSDGSKKTIAIKKEHITGYDKSKKGEQTLTITVESKTASFKVTVLEDKPEQNGLQGALNALTFDAIKGENTLQWAISNSTFPA